MGPLGRAAPGPSCRPRHIATSTCGILLALDGAEGDITVGVLNNIAESRAIRKDESLTVTVSDGPAGVVVTDAEKLERRFLRIPPPEPDKVLIGRALKDGEVVDGATLSNPQPVLRIKAT